jgi:capsular polysaccharide biosynthesis protein
MAGIPRFSSLRRPKLRRPAFTVPTLRVPLARIPRLRFGWLRRAWLLIVAGAIVGLAASGTFTVASTPQYESTAQSFVSTTIDPKTGADLANAQTFLTDRIKSYAILATSPAVLDRVIGSLKLDTTADLLARRVEVSVPLNTLVVSVTVTGADRDQVSAIANQVLYELPLAVKAVEDPTGKKTDPVTFVMVRQSQPSTEPSSPNRKLNLAAGLVLGVVAGLVAFALVRRRSTPQGTAPQGARASAAVEQEH